MARHALAEPAPLRCAPSPARAPRRRTIALFAPTFAYQGGLRSVAEFLCASIERHSDFDLRLFSLAMSWRDPCNLSLHRPSTWTRGPQVRDMTYGGRPFTHVGVRFGEFEFCRYAPNPTLGRLVADCDLIQVVAGSPAWAGPVLGLGKPVVLQVATLTEVERRQRQGEEHGPLAAWRAAMTRITRGHDLSALRAVDAVAVENGWMLETARALAAASTPVIYAPPGVDAEVFTPHGPTADNGGRPYILAVGRFSDRRKNLGLLLQAYARTLDALPEGPDLVLAGASEANPDFWAEVHGLGLADRVIVRLKPSREDLAALYRGALCLAVSSDEEGFGMVIIEAMACGTPVVSTRCGGPDLIISDGVDGFLVARGDDQAMAATLIELARRPGLAHAMGTEARLTVERRYAEPVAARAFLDLYETLLSEDR